HSQSCMLIVDMLCSTPTLSDAHYAYFLQYSSDLPLLHSFPTRRSSDLIAFASTVRALRAGGWGGDLDETAVADYLEFGFVTDGRDRKSTRLNSSHVSISYAVFCLKKKNNLYLNRNYDYCTKLMSYIYTV